MEYLVRWEINIEADSFEEAAKIALDVQRDIWSESTFFEVTDSNGRLEYIDLDPPCIP